MSQELRRARAALLVLSSIREESLISIREMDDCFILCRRTGINSEYRFVIDSKCKINIHCNHNKHNLGSWSEPQRTKYVHILTNGLSVSESEIASARWISLKDDNWQAYIHVNLGIAHDSYINFKGFRHPWSDSVVLDLIIRIKRKLGLLVYFTHDP